MALKYQINATEIKGAENISQYCWYCLEGVCFHEHNAWLLDDDFTGVTAMALRISVNIAGIAWKVFDSMNKMHGY